MGAITKYQPVSPESDKTRHTLHFVIIAEVLFIVCVRLTPAYNSNYRMHEVRHFTRFPKSVRPCSCSMRVLLIVSVELDGSDETICVPCIEDVDDVGGANSTFFEVSMTFFGALGNRKKETVVLKPNSNWRAAESLNVHPMLT